MKKNIFLFILVFLLLSPVLAIRTAAHPGRTDANGGHFDNSTGEYHYHHGYEAHNHDDVDGDGDIDCPFNFVDNTGVSSGKSNNFSNNGKINGGFNDHTIEETADLVQPTVVENEDPKGNTSQSLTEKLVKKEKGQNQYIIFSFLAAFIVILLFNFSFALDKSEHKVAAFRIAKIAFVIWIITFPISTFIILGYFEALKKKKSQK